MKTTHSTYVPYARWECFYFPPFYRKSVTIPACPASMLGRFLAGSKPRLELVPLFHGKPPWKPAALSFSVRMNQPQPIPCCGGIRRFAKHLLHWPSHFPPRTRCCSRCLIVAR